MMLRKCECGTKDMVSIHKHDYKEIMDYLRRGNPIMAFQFLLRYEEG